MKYDAKMKTSRQREHKYMRLCSAVTLLALFALIGAFQLYAQTITTGELGGTVVDPSGAVVPDATVQLKSLDEGSVSVVKSNAGGYYKFAVLKPGNYTITISATGFKSSQQRVAIALGASVAANFKLELGSSTTTVEVSATVEGVDTENANLNTNFDANQVALLPNPGNDLSAVALTAPGVVMNTAGGATYGGGNYEFYGLPAVSNLFTYDGANDNDPYFNVNSTGATNLSLGLNDVQETTVVANGYSGSYGGLAGANINFVSKSGTNAFHGNAEYWWNGRTLNANDYFFNQNGLPRPFVNDNQYATSFGGPIVKNKAFFFFDYEGIKLLIPSPTSVTIPTPAFATAVEGNVPASQLPFYTKIFANYARVNQAGAQQIPGGGCANVTAVGGVAFGAGNPCTVSQNAALASNAHDYLWVGRYDENIGNNDKLFIRAQHEHGFQPSYTDPFNPAFNLVSDQPEWQSQASETHTFGANIVNNFVASMTWYAAAFAITNEAANIAALPSTTSVFDSSLSTLNLEGNNQPQGRNITQYQFVDDFSWIRGRHNIQLGVNFRRDDVSDKTLGIETLPTLDFGSLADFVNGTGTPATPGGLATFGLQAFPSGTEVPIAMYGLGAYVADNIKVTRDLTVTLSFRMDHLSNPVCQTNCFQRLNGTFEALSHTGPLNAAILSGQHNAFPSVTPLAAEPKFGFAWSPRGSQKTVVRGGIGIFADSLPTGAIDAFIQAAPLDPIFQAINGLPAPATGPTSLTALLAASDAGFKANYAGGGAVNPINFTNSTKVVVPRYYEWSLEVQQSLGWHTTLSTMYVENHGSHEEIPNAAENAYSPTPFANLPTTLPDARFNLVTQIENAANSNYDGFVVSAKHSFTGGFQFQASYTFSHALDEISNNSFSPFGLAFNGNFPDMVYQQNPANIHQNYGNADYDVRHNFTMNYVWSDAFRHLTSWGPNALIKGWTFSGTIFRHSGLPITPYSSAVTSTLQGTNYGNGETYVTADLIGSSPTNCSGQAAKVNNPCWSASNFADPVGTYGDVRRNSFHGPGFFDTDFSVEKGFGIPKWEGAQFSVGARFFNFFNHPNFGFPVTNIASPQFGEILAPAVSTPTTIYGSGLGADASPRVIQLQAKFQF